LIGAYFWNWDPNAAEVGPGNGANFSPQELPAQTVVTNNFNNPLPRVPPTDFNGDGMSDALFRNNGTFDDWTMNGPQIAASQLVTYQGSGVNVDRSFNVDGIGDFNGDGKADVLFRNTNGTFTDWTMNGSQIIASQLVTYQGSAVNVDASFSVPGIGDFNGDGK